MTNPARRPADEPHPEDHRMTLDGKVVNLLDAHNDPGWLFDDPRMRRRQEVFQVAQHLAAKIAEYTTTPVQANVLAYALEALESEGLLAVFEDVAEVYRTMG